MYFATLNSNQMNTQTHTQDTVLAPKTLTTSDYEINYYGKVFEIKNTKKVLALFVSGSGYSYSDGYYGSDDFELYIPNKKDFGKTLILVGKGTTKYTGDTNSFYVLDGINYYVSGFAIDELFMKIFKK